MNWNGESWASAEFYVAYADGYRYVIKTGVDGIADNIQISYQEQDENTKQYVDKPLGEHMTLFDPDDIFVDTLVKAKEFAAWSKENGVSDYC